MAGWRGGCSTAVRWVAIVTFWIGFVPCHAAGRPLLAQGGAALLAPDLKEAGKPVKQAEPEAGAAAAEPAAEVAPQEKPSLVANLMKYGPSYLLMVLLVGLGTSIACVPRPGSLGQTDAGKGKGPGKK